MYGLEPLHRPVQESADGAMVPTGKAKGHFRGFLTGRLLPSMILVCIGYQRTDLLAVNIGAIVGALVASRLADRFGPRPLTAVSFELSGVALVPHGHGDCVASCDVPAGRRRWIWFGGSANPGRPGNLWRRWRGVSGTGQLRQLRRLGHCCGGGSGGSTAGSAPSGRRVGTGPACKPRSHNGSRYSVTIV